MTRCGFCSTCEYDPGDRLAVLVELVPAGGNDVGRDRHEDDEREEDRVGRWQRKSATVCVPTCATGLGGLAVDAGWAVNSRSSLGGLRSGISDRWCGMVGR